MAEKVLRYEQSTWTRLKRLCNRPEINFSVQRAPEPRDVIWENMAVTKAEKSWLVCKTTFLGLLLMVVCFCAILFISFQKTEHIDVKLTGDDSFGDTLWLRMLSVAVSCVITFFNMSGRFAVLRLVRS